MIAAERTVAVGIGELAVGRGAETLVAYGLGSCVGVAAWDPLARVGGLVHVMLPSSAGRPVETPGRFADSALPALLEALRSAGASPSRLVLKAVGGAQVLTLPGAGGTPSIGAKNVAAVRQEAARLGLRLAAEDVGGRIGRTVHLHVESGRVSVRAIGQEAREL